MNFRNKKFLKKGFKIVDDENFGVTDYYNEAVCEEIEGRESMNDTRTPTSYSSAASSDNPRFEIDDLTWDGFILSFSIKNEPMQADDIADDEETASDEGRTFERATVSYRFSFWSMFENSSKGVKALNQVKKIVRIMMI